MTDTTPAPTQIERSGAPVLPLPDPPAIDPDQHWEVDHVPLDVHDMVEVTGA